MKALVILTCLFLIALSQFVVEKPQRIKPAHVAIGSPLPPPMKRKKFKGYMRKG